MSVPGGYESSFVEGVQRRPEVERILQEIADGTVASLISEIIRAVDEFTGTADKGIVRPTATGTGRVLDAFRHFVPASNAESLGDIIYAGWQLYFDDRFWSEHKFSEVDKWDMLNDLVFKSIEVAEYNTRQKDGA